MTINTRDLHADLAICDAASPGEWSTADTTDGYYILDESDWVLAGTVESVEDARFIAESRQGWPEAIRRAIDAEAEVERLTAGKLHMERRAQDAISEVERLHEALTSIMQVSAWDGISHELDRCYVIAKEALGLR